MSDLIDPLNEDTYDRGAIWNHPSRMYLSGSAWEEYTRKLNDNFQSRRKRLLHEFYVLKFQLWKELHK